MLGFDINDIVSFMTSPAVNLVNQLSEASMFDDYVNDVNIEDAINLAEGRVDVSKFLVSGYTFTNEDKISKYISLTQKAFESADLKIFKNNDTKPTNLQEYVQAYIMMRLRGISLKELSKYINASNSEMKKSIIQLSDYVESLIYKISKYQSKYKRKDELFYDLSELRHLNELSDETSRLGNTLLGMNQGLPTDKESLQSKVRQIKDLMTKREKRFNIRRSLFKPQKELEKDDPNKKETDSKKMEKFTELVTEIKSNNDFLTVEKIVETLHKAWAFDLIDNFDLMKYLNNVPLTNKDIINKEFFGMEDTEVPPTTYRELVADYYNIIKGLWNVFDVVNKVPQYNKILDLLKTEIIIDQIASAKSKLFNDAYSKLFKRTKYINDKDNSKILKYIQDLLVLAYFEQNNISFPIYKGTEYLDNNYKPVIATFDRKLDLNTASGRASFKKVFESTITALQNTGKYGNTTIPNFKENTFLQGIRLSYDRNLNPYLAMELDMTKISATPENEKTFSLYINDFDKLRTIIIGDIPLSDWFIIYNLYNNQNQYGRDRLTTLFKNSIINKGSILEDYYKFLGELDFNELSENFLKDLGFNLNDLEIRMAPIVSKYQETKSESPYIIVYEQGEPILKKKIKRGIYKPVSMFPNHNQVTEEQKLNYQRYNTMPLLSRDFGVSLREGLKSSDIEIVIQTLRDYYANGQLTIETQNC